MSLIGIVRTNIEDDEFGRVKIVLQNKFPHPKERYKYDEKYGSDRVDAVLGTYLLPVINGVYCSKGDYVVIDDTYGYENMYIVGKVRSKAQKERSYAHGQNQEGIIVWESDYDEGSSFQWNMLQISKQNTYYANSSGVQIRVEDKNVIISTNEGNVTIKAGGNESIEITGNYDIKVEGNVTIQAQGNADVKAEGNATVKSSGDATVDAAGSTTVKAGGSATIEAPSVKITGGTLEVNGAVAPSTQGPFNSIPTCPFSGVPHKGTQVAGT